MKFCPFCGGEPTEAKTSNSSDERCGYNFIASVSCKSCNASVFIMSEEDKNGWCIESAESAKLRVIELWNKRSNYD